MQRWQGKGIVMDCRLGTTDWNTVNAAVGEDEYELDDVDLEGKLVFDVGAHIGSIGIWAAARGAFSIFVEPIPENVEMIMRNVELNHLEYRCRVFSRAAGEEGDRIDIRYGYTHDESHRAHAYIGNIGGSEGIDHKIASVEGLSLKKAIKECGTPDVLKLDCEGGEWAWLDEPSEIAKIPLIVGEWHPFPAGRVQSDVVMFLGGTHDVAFSGPEGGPGGFRAVRR